MSAIATGFIVYTVTGYGKTLLHLISWIIYECSTALGKDSLPLPMVTHAKSRISALYQITNINHRLLLTSDGQSPTGGLRTT